MEQRLENNNCLVMSRFLDLVKYEETVVENSLRSRNRYGSRMEERNKENILETDQR
jgi:hypothetical protein